MPQDGISKDCLKVGCKEKVKQNIKGLEDVEEAEVKYLLVKIL